jgi:hypothetical protein
MMSFLVVVVYSLAHILSEGFSTRFRSRAGLSEPTGINDIPAEERQQIDHQPGQDPLFEQVLNEERQLGEDETSDDSSYEFVEPPEDDPSDDGFSVISHSDANILDEPAEQEQADNNEEEEKGLSARMARARIDGDLLVDISKAVLEPVFGNFVVPDPDKLMYAINHPRTCHLLRVNVPAGVHPYDFVGSVSSDGSRLKFSATKDASRFDAKHTLGSKLGASDQLVSSLQGALTVSWASQTNNTMRRDAVVKEYVVDVPRRVTIENELRDPTNWNRAGPGQKGHFVFCTASNSLFYYLFFFEKENPNNAPPQNSFQNGINIDVQGAVNGMGGQHRAAAQYFAYQQPQAANNNPSSFFNFFGGGTGQAPPVVPVGHPAVPPNVAPPNAVPPPPAAAAPYPYFRSAPAAPPAQPAATYQQPPPAAAAAVPARARAPAAAVPARARAPAAAAHQYAAGAGTVRPFPSGGFDPSGGRSSTRTRHAFAGVENMELVVAEVIPPDGPGH